MDAFSVKMKLSVVVFLVLFQLSHTQDENAVVFSEMASQSTQTETTAICDTCNCTAGYINCDGLDIRKPFGLGDWEGLRNFTPTTVDLSNNPIAFLTRIPELPIQTLNLTNCEIEKIENSCFMNLYELVNLDLSKNHLPTSALSKRVFEGKMSEPPADGSAAMPELRPFPNMRFLSLADNDIHSLPQDLFTFMVEVTVLDLSFNQLAFIDQVTMAAITELTKLKDLRLSSCELESLPEGLFRRQRRLERLDLSDNRFTTIPSVLSEATNLVFLSLDRNPITTIEEKTSIAGLKKLQELRLCRLSKLQKIAAGTLGGLENLVSLHICYNPRLTTLDSDALMWEDEHEAEHFPLLKELYLNNNNLTGISSHILDRWDSLVDVDFTNNPFVCDCNNQWMVDVLVPLVGSTAANDTASNMICKKPKELRGMSFETLRKESKTLTCSDISSDTSYMPTPNMAIVLGIMIGIFVTFPIVLVLILLWRRGYFARCRRTMNKEKEFDEEENDAF